jgi:hypothetical protein
MDPDQLSDNLAGTRASDGFKQFVCTVAFQQVGGGNVQRGRELPKRSSIRRNVRLTLNLSDRALADTSRTSELELGPTATAP